MSDPRWLSELSLSLASNPQVVLTGNVRDLHVLGTEQGAVRIADTRRALDEALRARGMLATFFHDPVDGLTCSTTSPAPDAIRTMLNAMPDADRRTAMDALDGKAVELAAAKRALAPLMSAIVESRQAAAALVLDYASWLTPGDDHDAAGGDATTRAPEAIRKAATLAARAVPFARGHATPLYNPIIWIVRQQSELPTWLVSSPGVRIISIEEPGQDTRRAFGGSLLMAWPDFAAQQIGSPAREDALDLFTSVTEGSTLREARDIVNLARDQGMAVADLPAAQFAYRVGVVESEWEKPALKARVRVFEQGGQRRDLCLEGLHGSIQGQDAAVQKAAEIVQRAVLGLAGSESSTTNPHRPKGVLFFAGPTGVGKTLLAKAITEVVFGRADNYTRFDMSEYSQEHAEARLVGAPPGYVGYSAGGQLTEAVRKRPFLLLLFDEVEKAHPLILDKFLQVLDEGRLTDGSGLTVNFSETIIVFTSNLGIVEQTRDAMGNFVTRERVRYSDRFPKREGSLDFGDLEDGVRAAVRDYFVTGIRRPELLNRIGQGNIIVFDFIDPNTASRILDRAVSNVLTVVEQKHGTRIQLAPSADQQLRQLAMTDRTLAMGGRGLNSAVEEFLVNPLSRRLAQSLDDAGRLPFRSATITGLTQATGSRRWDVVLEPR